MTDVHTIAVRSKNMAAIRGCDTKPEICVRKALHQAGFRYRLHVSTLPGRPDLVFPKYKSVIFVQGCFWHMHQCAMFHWPKTRAEWWKAKLMRNRAHDELVQDKLREMGWRVYVVWECALRGKNRLSAEQLVASFTDWLNCDLPYGELPAPE
ncbi:very short patch repair endonuclease [Rheinheimera sp.]|uniref:very short patch repair endonuclease n=1 Tax=Rheinheimera sp. TaxID=1869214 RepID=UPI00307E0BC5